MSAPEPAPDRSPPRHLAELLMTAAALDASPTRPVLTPIGTPVRRGRLHIGRARTWLGEGSPLTVAAGFATACWLGKPGAAHPDLGRLVYRTETSCDRRGRLVLDLRVRAWLAVADSSSFEVVTMPAVSGGLLVVPVEDFARRLEAVTP